MYEVAKMVFNNHDEIKYVEVLGEFKTRKEAELFIRNAERENKDRNTIIDFI